MSIMEIVFGGFFLVVGVGVALYTVYAVISEVRSSLASRRVMAEWRRAHAHD